LVRGSDFFGVATSLSGPPESALRNQVTSELIYRLQLTENLQVSPNIQFTINPSQTLETDALWVVGVLRLRLAL
jgi:carbohydrate-selective porin OprB